MWRVLWPRDRRVAVASGALFCLLRRLCNLDGRLRWHSFQDDRTGARRASTPRIAVLVGFVWPIVLVWHQRWRHGRPLWHELLHTESNARQSIFVGCILLCAHRTDDLLERVASAQARRFFLRHSRPV